MKNRLNIILLFVAISMVSCSDEKDESAVINIDETISDTEDDSGLITLTKSQFESSKMKLGTLTNQEFAKSIKTNGEIVVSSENKASVSAYYGGYVKSFALIEGQEIKKGQTLFTLENPDYIEVQKNYLEIKNQLEYLKSDYERQKGLAADNVVSQKTFLKAQTEYNVAKVSFEAYKKELKLMNINPNNISETNLKSTISVAAPIGGFVTQINLSKGMFLNPSDIAVRLINTDNLLVELNIYEQDLQKISMDQKVIFTLQNNTKTYNAKVYLINKSIDTDTRLVHVLCTLENKAENTVFTPGMYLEAEILTTHKNGLALPENAVINIEDSYFALILNNKDNQEFTFEKVALKIGTRKKGYVEILNEAFVTNPPTFLITGAFNLINE